MGSNELEPPFYVLVAHTQLPSYSVAGPGPTTLSHPTIQYHFADDPSHAILPSSDAETVIVLDYTSPAATPVAESLRKALAVTGVKMSEAPGTAVGTKDGDLKRNNKMYVVETMSLSEEM